MVSDEDDYLGELEMEGEGERGNGKEVGGEVEGWLFCIYIRSGRR